MIKKNYTAWHVSSKDFSEDWSNSEKLFFFARYAILAPSGHNTQPWHFSKKGEKLLLSAEPKRSLPHSGVKANEPYVSLGSCLGTLQLAAQGFGYTLEIKYLEKNAEGVAIIGIAKRIKPNPHILEAIVNRVSNRSYYTNNTISKESISKITDTSIKNVTVHLLSKKNEIESIAELTRKATLITFSDKDFRKELSKWVRNNVTKQNDGMPGFVQGIPTPPSLLAKNVMYHLNIAKSQANKDYKRTIHTPYLLILSIPNKSRRNLLNVGMVFASICIKAQQQGLATTGSGAAIIEPETIKEVKKLLKTNEEPMAVIRLGRATKPAKHAPRWPVDSVVS